MIDRTRKHCTSIPARQMRLAARHTRQLQPGVCQVARCHRHCCPPAPPPCGLARHLHSMAQAAPSQYMPTDDLSLPSSSNSSHGRATTGDSSALCEASPCERARGRLNYSKVHPSLMIEPLDEPARGRALGSNRRLAHKVEPSCTPPFAFRQHAKVLPTRLPSQLAAYIAR